MKKQFLVIQSISLLGLSALMGYASLWVHLGCSKGDPATNPIYTCLEKMYPNPNPPAADVQLLDECCEADQNGKWGKLKDFGATTSGVQQLCKCRPTKCLSIGSIARIDMLRDNTEKALGATEKEAQGNGRILGNAIVPKSSPSPGAFSGFENVERAKVDERGQVALEGQTGSAPPSEGASKDGPGGLGGGQGKSNGPGGLLNSVADLLNFGNTNTAPVGAPSPNAAAASASTDSSSGAYSSSSGAGSGESGSKKSRFFGSVNLKDVGTKQMSFGQIGGSSSGSGPEENAAIERDPEDYFQRIESKSNLFEIIRKRYESVTRQNAL